MKTIKQIEIYNNQILLDGNLLYPILDEKDLKVESPAFADFSKNVYTHFDINYPKFFKMSNMCKLGFLAAELLLKNQDMTATQRENCSVVLSCNSSSLHTDFEYQQTINDVPSPALFVYTLPNIVIGEICIRHGFKGEEMMFVSEKNDMKMLNTYVNALFKFPQNQLCISGFINFDNDTDYYATFFLIINKHV